jgi:predicted dehydrogenase
MVTIAVLGCGRIGRMHARNLARHPRAKLVSVFDIAPESPMAWRRWSWPWLLSRASNPPGR